VSDGSGDKDEGLGRKALDLVDWILDKAIEGVPPLEGPEELAAEYRADPAYRSVEDRVKALIRWEASKNFASGFATGLGGLVTLPLAIPAALGASWILQARLAAATAVLHGHSLKEDRVRTLVLLAILGNSAKEVAKSAGVIVGQRITLNAIRGIPGRALIELNKRVGLRLLAKAGQTGVVHLAKAVPLVGGLVGGALDATLCLAVGKSARQIFAAEPPVLEAEVISPRPKPRRRATAGAQASRKSPKAVRTGRPPKRKPASAVKKTAAKRAPRARRSPR
jgi:hypothetical protein